LNTRPARLLVVGGSDSGGGAGIQADIKTATALGVYAMTAVTAVTAQDTTGVRAIALMPPALVRAQMVACFADIGADAVKIGMLGSVEIALTVMDVLRKYAHSTSGIVLDTVLTSSSGTPLLDHAGIEILRQELIPISTLVTSNIPEAEILSGIACGDVEGMKRAGLALMESGSKAALVKGGHGSSAVLTDVLIEAGRATEFSHPRQNTIHTHGTGCTYATAIACGVVQQMTLRGAIARAHEYVQAAITSAPGFGSGYGPLNHMYRIATDWD
jgi:hydroxymethylpyrimidine/phosphomethylpyrimidine kinase